MKIVALEVENVKHLRVVHIKPDGSLIVVGGDNTHGKSCVLDSIEYALNGAGAVPAKPVRKGQKKARVVLDLGDIVVTRTFTAKGTNLTVKSKDGATFASPQAMLDKLVGELTFDPLEFSKMAATRQTEVLKQLVGLNFDKLNAKHKLMFDKRTVVNRHGRELKASLDGMTKHDDVPDEEVSIQGMSAKYIEAVNHNQAFERDRLLLSQESDELKRLAKQVTDLKKSVKQRLKALEGVNEIDAKAIQSQLADAETVNHRVRENKRYMEVEQELAELRKESALFGTHMADIVDDKSKALAKANFPIEGLALDDDCVTFEGLPLVQCSSAQRISISVAIGLAMNPQLRVLLIREGSLLDASNLALIADMATKADAQIWLERVSKGAECTVVMEDGAIVDQSVGVPVVAGDA